MYNSGCFVLKQADDACHAVNPMSIAVILLPASCTVVDVLSCCRSDEHLFGAVVWGYRYRIFKVRNYQGLYLFSCCFLQSFLWISEERTDIFALSCQREINDGNDCVRYFRAGKRSRENTCIIPAACAPFWVDNARGRPEGEQTRFYVR